MYLNLILLIVNIRIEFNTKKVINLKNIFLIVNKESKCEKID